MLTLAFDTSSPAVTVAVVDDGQTVAQHREIAENRHGELLMPLIHRTFGDAGVMASSIQQIGVGLGPGPFTGLRVGVVTAMTMGDALGVAVYGVCSLDAIALDAAMDEGPFAVLTDARRKQVYWATYDDSGMRTGGPDIGRPGDLSVQLSEVRTLAGAGAVLYRDDFPDHCVGADYRYPNAVTIATSGTSQLAIPSTDPRFGPLYLRRPDAQPPGRPKQVTPA